MEGTFLLADISGYSRYLDEAGLKHASNVTAKLLNSLITVARKPWRVANLEGDAVFFVHPGRLPVDRLFPHIRTLFRAFFDRVLDIGQDVDCGCGACGAANQLTLKFMVHAGSYETRLIGGREEFIGPDVVIAHRLLKPEIHLSEYVLATRSYVGEQQLPLFTMEGTLELQEPVPFLVADLGAVRREIEEARAIFVTPRHAIVHSHAEVAASPDRVWDTLVDRTAMQEWSGARKVLEFPARASRIGTAYRWILPDGYEFGQVLIAMDEHHRRLTFRRTGIPLFGHLYSTFSVGSRNGGSTVHVAIGASRHVPLARAMVGALKGRHPVWAQDALQRLKAYWEDASLN